jgi:flagellar export protein FliJ
MQRFRFRLESVLAWRRLHLELEETKLQRLFEELRRVDLAGQRLDAEKAQEERAVLYAASVEARELAALESYRQHVRREKERLRKERADCQARVAAQRGLVLKAERDVRLLEKLREKRLGEWQAAADKEQEALASELFLAQWHRQ